MGFVPMAASTRIDRWDVHLSKTISFCEFFRFTLPWNDHTEDAEILVLSVVLILCHVQKTVTHLYLSSSTGMSDFRRVRLQACQIRPQIGPH